MVQVLSRLKQHGQKVQGAVADQTMSYVTAALGVVAGLAWNDAVKSAIDYFFPAESATIVAQFLYAIIVTLIVVVLTLLLRRLFGLVKPKVTE
ncbi:MAG: DUF5654 family protein [Patescibacteria group bacterium]